MPDEMLRLLFRVQREACETRDDSCPGEDRIAQLIGQTVSEEERSRLKAHVADCPSCASRLADALRTSGSRTTTARTSAYDRSIPGFRATAAAAVLAAVAITAFWQLPDDGMAPGESGELRAVRPPETVPSLIFPTEGQNVSPAGITVRWTPVADAIHYSVRIVDEYGRLVIESFADAPRFTVPPHIRLAPDVDYYVKINAYVMGDKAVSSSHIHFTVAE